MEPIPNEPPEAAEPQPQPRRRHYGPRKCRICLEDVEPTWEDAGFADNLLNRNQKPKYISDPELGRLFSPCKCKGSQKYVHEGCLDMWRSAHGDRSMWKCPTCSFQYRLEWIGIGNMVSHWATSLVLTIIVVSIIVFCLGFFADVIVDYVAGPIGLLLDDADDLDLFDARYNKLKEELPDMGLSEGLRESWAFHFAKGFWSLGVIGFLKVIWVMGPFNWFNLNTHVNFGGRRRRRGGGRDRIADISWWVLLIGALTFIWGVWKSVRLFCRRALDRAKERIIEVQGDDDDEEEEVPRQGQREATEPHSTFGPQAPTETPLGASTAIPTHGEARMRTVGAKTDS